VGTAKGRDNNNNTPDINPQVGKLVGPVTTEQKDAAAEPEMTAKRYGEIKLHNGNDMQ